MKIKDVSVLEHLYINNLYPLYHIPLLISFSSLVHACIKLFYHNQRTSQALVYTCLRFH